MPKLQTAGGTMWFLRDHRGNPTGSLALFAAIGNRFRDSVKGFAMSHDISLIRFGKDDRQIDVVRPLLAAEQAGRAGVVAIRGGPGAPERHGRREAAHRGGKAVKFSFARRDRR